MRPVSANVHGAGDLRHRVIFQRRTQLSDGAGNTRADFQTIFSCAASIMPKLGGETVLAARLEGTQVWLITIRYCVQALQVTPEWRAVDARHTNRIFAIKTIVDPNDQRNFLELTAETGVAA